MKPMVVYVPHLFLNEDGGITMKVLHIPIYIMTYRSTIRIARARASDRREKKPYRRMIRRTVERHVGQAWMELVEQVWNDWLRVPSSIQRLNKWQNLS